MTSHTVTGGHHMWRLYHDQWDKPDMLETLGRPHRQHQQDILFGWNLCRSDCWHIITNYLSRSAVWQYQRINWAHRNVFIVESKYRSFNNDIMQVNWHWCTVFPMFDIGRLFHWHWCTVFPNAWHRQAFPRLNIWTILFELHRHVTSIELSSDECWSVWKTWTIQPHFCY